MSQELKNALKNFTAGRHRIERFEFDFKGKKLVGINDSKATNPHSVVAACKTFAPPHKKLHIILGGLDKDMDFTPLASLSDYLKKVIVYGRCGSAVGKGFAGKNDVFDAGNDFSRCSKS